MFKQLLGYGRSIIRSSQLPIDSLSFNGLPSVCILQARNTIILKRRFPPGLHKKDHAPKRLKPRHYVYDLVEDTNCKKKEDIELLLTGYVAGLGDAGDKVSVKPRYGYNDLLLPGLAVYPTPENIAKYCDSQDESRKSLHSSRTSERAVSILSKQILAVTMNKEMPWKVEPWHIRASFRKAGFHVPEEAIEMPEESIEGPNLNIEGKEFVVTVTVNNQEKVQVRCRIHHWSTAITDRLPFVEDHWKLPAEPIFATNSGIEQA